ncbi:MAG: hypothetical protein DMG63_11945, partial [Acidobacteria bacterium]
MLRDLKPSSHSVFAHGETPASTCHAHQIIAAIFGIFPAKITILSAKERMFVNGNRLAVLISLALSTSLSWAQAVVSSSEPADILVNLIKINTSNPPGNETQAAQYIKGLLTAEGISSEIFESAGGRGNLVARLKGTGKARPLMLMAHLDVVGVERDKWTVDPFAGIIKDGYIYGRGASDDKGMLAANIA